MFARAKRWQRPNGAGHDARALPGGQAEGAVRAHRDMVGSAVTSAGRHQYGGQPSTLAARKGEGMPIAAGPGRGHPRIPHPTTDSPCAGIRHQQ